MSFYSPLIKKPSEDPVWQLLSNYYGTREEQAAKQTRLRIVTASWSVARTAPQIPGEPSIYNAIAALAERRRGTAHYRGCGNPADHKTEPEIWNNLKRLIENAPRVEHHTARSGVNIHSKYILIDGPRLDRNARVLCGTANLTTLRSSWDTLLELYPASTLFESFNNDFDLLWNQATQPASNALCPDDN